MYKTTGPLEWQCFPYCKPDIHTVQAQAGGLQLNITLIHLATSSWELRPNSSKLAFRSMYSVQKIISIITSYITGRKPKSGFDSRWREADCIGPQHRASQSSTICLFTTFVRNWRCYWPCRSTRLLYTISRLVFSITADKVNRHNQSIVQMDRLNDKWVLLIHLPSGLQTVLITIQQLRMTRVLSWNGIDFYVCTTCPWWSFPVHTFGKAPPKHVTF